MGIVGGWVEFYAGALRWVRLVVKNYSRGQWQSLGSRNKNACVDIGDFGAQICLETKFRFSKLCRYIRLPIWKWPVRYPWSENLIILHLQCWIARSSKMIQYTLPETNSSPLKIDGWKMNFLLGMAHFQELCLLVLGSVYDCHSKSPLQAGSTFQFHDVSYYIFMFILGGVVFLAHFIATKQPTDNSSVAGGFRSGESFNNIIKLLWIIPKSGIDGVYYHQYVLKKALYQSRLFLVWLDINGVVFLMVFSIPIYCLCLASCFFSQGNRIVKERVTFKNEGWGCISMRDSRFLYRFTCSIQCRRSGWCYSLGCPPSQ